MRFVDEMITRFAVEGLERTLSAMRSMAAATESVAEKQERMGRSLRQVGATMLGLSAPVDVALGLALKHAMQIERLEIAYTRLLGSQERAAAFLKEMARFAERTPFQFEQVAAFSQQLLAVGVPAEKVLRYMRAIGDAVAATGGTSVELERALRAVTQMLAKGRIYSEELMQLMEAHIPARTILAEALGVSGAQLEQILRRGLGAWETIDAFMRALERRYGGMMRTMMRTTSGALSNLQDALAHFAATAGKPLLQPLTELVSTATKALDAFNQFAEAHPHLARLAVYSTVATSALLKFGGASAMVAGTILQHIAQKRRHAEMMRVLTRLTHQEAAAEAAKAGVAVKEAAALGQVARAAGTARLGFLGLARSVGLYGAALAGAYVAGRLVARDIEAAYELAQASREAETGRMGVEAMVREARRRGLEVEEPVYRGHARTAWGWFWSALKDYLTGRRGFEEMEIGGRIGPPARPRVEGRRVRRDIRVQVEIPGVITDRDIDEFTRLRR